jgi:hypothetical protein
VLVTFLLVGISGPVTGSAGGSFFWFACGIAAYWLGGRRWRPPSQELAAGGPGAGAIPPEPVALPA